MNDKSRAALPESQIAKFKILSTILTSFEDKGG